MKEIPWEILYINKIKWGYMQLLKQQYPHVQGYIYPCLGTSGGVICCSVCPSSILSGVQETNKPAPKIATINNTFVSFIMFFFCEVNSTNLSQKKTSI